MWHVLPCSVGGWRGRWHAQNWWRSLERYAFPRIGRRPVSEVNTADVLEILSPIWHVKAETARAVRQRIRSVLEWAIAMDLRNDNPADRVLPVPGPQSDIVTHRQALPHKDVAAAIETVRTSSSPQPAVKLAFEYLVRGRGLWPAQSLPAAAARSFRWPPRPPSCRCYRCSAPSRRRPAIPALGASADRPTRDRR